MKRIIGIALVLTLALGGAAVADVVKLKNGERITGKVTGESEETITLETQFGKLTIPRSDVESIERSHPDRDEYLRRAARLAKKHRELARWCNENGLEKEERANLATAAKLEKKPAAPEAKPSKPAAPEAKPSKPAAPEKKPSEPAVEIDLSVFDAVWEAVRDRFYDRQNYNGCNWKAMRKKYLPRAKAAGSRPELYDICNQMLGELNASHCYLWPPYLWENHFANEFQGKKSMQAGLDILKAKDKYFVRAIYEGGPADRAGVKVGDELVSVDGRPPAENVLMILMEGTSNDEHALYTLRADHGAAITLKLRRTEGAQTITIEVTPEMTSMLQAARNSIRVIERGGKKLGYIHLWHFMNREMVSALRDAITGKLKNCDGLILDIRGRGGSPLVLAEAFWVFSRGQWNKPTVLVVDERTASAKEVFAYHWKRRKLGPVVGCRTAGHVLGGTMIAMPDGSMLLLAIARMTTMSGGVDLEGAGVEPDVKVEQTFKHCKGKHPILKEATDKLIKELEEADKDSFLQPSSRLREAA